MNVTTPEVFVPPRPPMAPDFGWLRSLKIARTNALEIWPRAAYEQDVLIQRFLGRRRMLLNSPEAIQRVLVDNTINYKRVTTVVRLLRPLVGNGLILSEGDEWRHQRRTMAPALAPRIIPVLARHIAAATDDEIVRLAAQRGPIDLLAAIQVTTLEIAARSMFSLEMTRYGVAFRNMLANFGARLARPDLLDMILPLRVPAPRDGARREFRVRWLALMDDIISARLEARTSEKPRDLFDMLLAARDPETGVAFSREQLCDQVATMIVAGHETTALTLFWSIYLLASAPAEQELLAREVCDVDLRPEVAGDALTQLPVTRAVVNETLRLFPPGFVIARTAIADDQAGGHFIPKRSMVMISQWVLHRHTRL
jgi:cytochrome P450